MIGVDWIRNGRVCCSAGPSARAVGRSASVVAPSWFANGVALSSVDSACASVRRQLLERRADVRVLRGERLEVRVRGVDELGELRVLLAQLVGEQLEVVDDAARVLAPVLEQARDLLDVARRRLEALERLAQVGRQARVLERLAAGGQQHDEVVARVAVERRQDLVEVDVRRGLRDRDRVAFLERAGRLVARVHLDDHVLQAGLRAQQHRRVLVDRRVLLADLQVDDGDAVLERDLADLADRHAGDVDRLALAGDDGLRRRELGVDLVEVGADARHPLRQVEPLVRGDVDRHAHGDHEQQEDRQEVAQVDLDRDASRTHPDLRGVQVRDLVLVTGELAVDRRLLGRARPGACRSASAGSCRTAAGSSRRPCRSPSCRSTACSCRRPSGSACTGRCRRSSATRRRGRSSPARTPCSSRGRSSGSRRRSSRRRWAGSR